MECTALFITPGTFNEYAGHAPEWLYAPPWYSTLSTATSGVPAPNVNTQSHSARSVASYSSCTQYPHSGYTKARTQHILYTLKRASLPCLSLLCDANCISSQTAQSPRGHDRRHRSCHRRRPLLRLLALRPPCPPTRRLLWARQDTRRTPTAHVHLQG
jgi:hypothetical protein